MKKKKTEVGGKEDVKAERKRKRRKTDNITKERRERQED